jgi:hypothetical protein
MHPLSSDLYELILKTSDASGIVLQVGPPPEEAMMKAVLMAVAAAPPPAFSGGGKWEAMHGDMSGFFEIRVDGPQRHHYRREQVRA